MKKQKKVGKLIQDLIPEGSVVFGKIVVNKILRDQQKTTGLTDGQKFAKFVLFGYGYVHSGIRGLLLVEQ